MSALPPPVTVVLALAPGSEDGSTAFLGLTLLDRALLALQYGGAAEVTLLTDAHADQARAAVAARARKLTCHVASAPPEAAGPLLLVAGDAVLNPGAVKAALARAAKPGPPAQRLGGEHGGLAIVRDGVLPVLAAARGGFDAGLAAAGAAGSVETQPLPPLAVAVRYGRAGKREASREMTAALRKGGDSWYTRYVSRTLSLPLSRALSWTPITPNMVTCGALVCGLACAVIVFRATTHWELVLGYLMGELGEVFDASDGEVARLTYKFSPYGTWLDTIVDDIASIAIHIATAFAMQHFYGNQLMATVGWIGSGCFVFYVCVLYYDLKVYVGSGDAHAFRWWISPGSSSHSAGEELLAGTRQKFQISDLTRTLSNREILILAYLVTAAARILPVGVAFFAAVAGGLAFVSAGQVIVGYPGEKVKRS